MGETADSPISQRMLTGFRSCKRRLSSNEHSKSPARNYEQSARHLSFHRPQKGQTKDYGLTE